MDRKLLLLHELLQQDQEPFHLKTYISDKRSQLRNSSPPTAPNLRKRTSADVRRSKSKPQIRSVGLCFLGSLLKILKNRSRKRVLRDCDFTEKENSEEIRRISCSCNRLSGDDHLRASTSSQRPELFYEIRDFEFCSSPFRYCLHKSPAASPPRRVKQEEEDCADGVEEEKEQSSPVSVLDTFFEDDAQESLVEEEEEDDDEELERSYANIERARQQLLDRLRRFEKLLDPVDLEQKLLEASDEGVESEEGMKPAASVKQSPMKTMMMKKCFFDKTEAALDWKAELDEWRRAAEAETAAEVELAIFGGLMEELSDDLLCSCMDATASPTLSCNFI